MREYLRISQQVRGESDGRESDPARPAKIKAFVSGTEVTVMASSGDEATSADRSLGAAQRRLPLRDRPSGHRKARRHLAHALERLSGGEAKPVNEHLIGSVGKVTSHSRDSTRSMRVRLGLESWPARLGLTEEDPLPLGNAV